MKYITNDRFRTANELLHEFWERCAITVQVPVDIEGICSFQGIKLVKDNSDDNFIGKVTQNTDGEVEIHINMNKNEFFPRYRFTLAHEIAHYNLHLRTGLFQEYRDTDETLFRKEDNWNPQEAEANRFAAQLLMPNEHMIVNALDIISKSDINRRDFIRNMAIVFDVSNMAMEFRLINMGMIEPSS